MTKKKAFRTTAYGLTLAERLDRYSIPEPNSGCLLWMANTGSRGYGTLKYKHRTILAHRVSYEVNIGPIPTGLWVLHKCDNPGCIEPTHLFLGTAHDNTQDMISKGRWRGAEGLALGRKIILAKPDKPWRQGERSHLSKLTEEQVRAIRGMPRLAWPAQKIVAANYGISAATVYSIQRGETWKHLLPKGQLSLGLM